MQGATLAEVFSLTILGAIDSVRAYLPRFIAGLIVLVLGFIIAGIARKLVLGLLKALRVGKFLVSIKVVKEEGEIVVWEVILAELIRWSLFILFLI